ncbi:triacylglycerol lipase OBL1-like isoform X2 [Macadamia integrifolia]|uniref:triacylglycerol lipase OBL1-like isoform X2 n=1 Tax=Macadamia integrifolia TaxID=60698 RepID=UPI001C4ED819|nr:triacylglycerol lipase OBL1-like isoform X2 [Macadamia integrifolia]
MASSGSSSYMIYHHENLNISNIFSILVFGRSLEGSDIVECGPQETKPESFLDNLITLITLILQRAMIWLSGPAALVGLIIEFTLNLFVLNGGIFGLPIRIITGSLKIPKLKSADYQSIIALIDDRKSLQNSYLSSLLLIKIPVHAIKFINPLDLCMMASKMHLVGFYNFWNESLQRNDTQAFIFCDKPENAEMIVVAFRGTELFNLRDWATDIDLSWLNLGEMGKVHVGFMRALGFQKDAKDAQTGWPKENKGDKVLAYYTIKEKLRQLLEQNPNAKILVTGHSLGGALAILFPAILLYHQENSILDRLCGVYTFGQPRVGDRKFGYIMEKQLNGTSRRYYRVVYRYDIVPRVPPQWSLLPFAHFGVCIYYKSWYKAQISKEEPDKNYFNLLYFPSQYINAWFDLFRGLFAGIRHGKEFKEGSIPIGARLFGLLIPGLASHGPRDYVNGTRLGNIEIMEEDNI